MLRKNQKDALEISIQNDFTSGVHFHATGTGKSFIAFKILDAFFQRYPKQNVLWICEHQTILSQLFDPKNLHDWEKQILQHYHLLKFYNRKDSEWANTVNCSKFWNKPALIIINRPFLTSQERYKKLGLSISLVLHDECHTCTNNTTQEFYSWLLEKNPNIKCIGFSATPVIGKKPFDTILGSYSIYDAFCDNVIVPPRILWTNKNLTDPLKMAHFIWEQIQPLSFKKIIVWCGMIQNCYSLAKLWKSVFTDFFIGVDTSLETDSQDLAIFLERPEKAILFCAAKHREGSDIKNLDGCVFLDGVTKRLSKTFIQCIGRVLRKDPSHQKKFGLILDLKAKTPSQILERINPYMNITNEFPWKYTQQAKVYCLEMVKHSLNPVLTFIEDNVTVETLLSRFVRKIPTTLDYQLRLEHEINLLTSKKLLHYLLRAVEILEMTKGIPHVTRGSCGSSLVCYALGISHVDPVAFGIRFARFLHEHRNTLPDIDYDFPYDKRDQVFMELELRWPGKVARISNHVYFHEKSAVRQALRNAGIRKFIAKHDIKKEIYSLDSFQQNFVKKETQRLENTFRGYSLHCGGIVFFPEGVPTELCIGKKGLLNQIHLNKENISKNKQFKIDILSSRALAQLNGFHVNFEIPILESRVFEMISMGYNIGLTLAESPLIRKSFIKIKPKSIHDIAVCLSIIRPAAKDARLADQIEKNMIIFDDDAIELIAETLHCTDAEADKYRRAFSKRDSKIISEFQTRISGLDKELQKLLLNRLKSLQHYSFCKSHAYSYAQLIYQLAWTKIHYPRRFWKNTLRHCHSSYRKWVHLFEARCVGVFPPIKELSIYTQNRRKGLETLDDPYEQLRKYGTWDMTDGKFFPNCFLKIEPNGIHFRGIIAESRTVKGKHIFFLGVGPQHYIDAEWKDDRPFLSSSWIGMEARAQIIDAPLQRYNVLEYFLF